MMDMFFPVTALLSGYKRIGFNKIYVKLRWLIWFILLCAICQNSLSEACLEVGGAGAAVNTVNEINSSAGC